MISGAVAGEGVVVTGCSVGAILGVAEMVTQMGATAAVIYGVSATTGLSVGLCGVVVASVTSGYLSSK
ncbi:MAG: hypothetical protein OXF02_03455 [Simkaniaceae bacterium]|nr:hypothetical protein [Simkaniaceae bacterium]